MKAQDEESYRLSHADQVWNRACTLEVDPRFLGDRALVALLLFHGLAMNGGMLHAFECLKPDELEAARSGYSFFGFQEIADLIIEVGSTFDPNAIYESEEEDDTLDSLESALWQRYTRVIPDDNTLSARFKRHFLYRRSDFAAL
jgi:hypothetical protein